MNIDVDIVSVERIGKLYKKYGTRFTNKILTETEKQINYFKSQK